MQVVLHINTKYTTYPINIAGKSDPRAWVPSHLKLSPSERIDLHVRRPSFNHSIKNEIMGVTEGSDSQFDPC